LEPHFQAADSDLEELVEVVAEDREELRALEHRQRLSVGERENSLVEIEPGGLAIEEAAARLLADDREFCRELAASGRGNGSRLWLFALDAHLDQHSPVQARYPYTRSPPLCLPPATRKRGRIPPIRWDWQSSPASTMR